MEWLEEKIRTVFLIYRIESALITLSLITAILSFFLFYKTNQKNNTYRKSERFIFVDISGAVKKPGLYQLLQGARIEEAIKMAGGYTKEADLSYVEQNMNRAEVLTDQYKIYIPTKEEASKTVSENQDSPSLVSINSADMSDLEKLPNVGTVTAEKILNSRPYKALDELLTKGVISKKLYEKIRLSISL